MTITCVELTVTVWLTIQTPFWHIASLTGGGLEHGHASPVHTDCVVGGACVVTAAEVIACVVTPPEVMACVVTACVVETGAVTLIRMREQTHTQNTQTQVHTARTSWYACAHTDNTDTIIRGVMSRMTELPTSASNRSLLGRRVAPPNVENSATEPSKDSWQRTNTHTTISNAAYTKDTSQKTQINTAIRSDFAGIPHAHAYTTQHTQHKHALHCSIGIIQRAKACEQHT